MFKLIPPSAEELAARGIVAETPVETPVETPADVPSADVPSAGE